MRLVACVAALGATGCGGDVIDVARNDPTYRGALLFNERCSGCHTLDAAAARGSKPQGQISGGERTNGPNLSIRKENRQDVIYAIRNGGFSGAIMPANIVVGKDAEVVADFVAKYAGGSVPRADGPGGSDAGRGSTGN
jgi:mono/diheme cytochrome c family protein